MIRTIRTMPRWFSPRAMTTLVAVSGLALLAPIAAHAGTTVTLTFEGLKDGEEVLNYYNGGFGSDGSGPGPNYGVTFGSAALASIADAAGGSGNFADNPSGVTTVFFLSGGGLVMNVAGGFTGGFSFYFASGGSTGSVTVYDGPNGTGNALATVQLPATGENCDGSNYTFSCWQTSGITFTGTAQSVNFAGVADQIGFDNITLGSNTPNDGVIITTPSLASGAVGVAYSQTVSATGGVPPYHWAAKGLPQGLSIDPNSGAITGTPQATGSYTVTISATDSEVAVPAQTGTNTYTLVIGPALASLSPSSAAAGSGPLTMQVTGAGFDDGSIVVWTPRGGKPVNLATTFQSATVLQATVPASLLTTAGAASVTVANASLMSSSLIFTITAPILPSLAVISPTEATAGSGNVTLQLSGNNFTQTSVVQWTPQGGTPTNLATTFQSLISLQATVPASLLTTAGTASVTVANSPTLVSGSQTFTIVAPPTPTVTSITPATAVAGSANLTVQVTGTNFSAASVVEWTPQGSGVVPPVTPLATTFISGTSLQAVVPASLLAAPGTASMTVVNASGGSNAQTFTITAPNLPSGLTLAIPTPVVLPTDQPALAVTISSPALVDYTGTIQLSFVAAGNVSNWPAGQGNQQVVFTGGTMTTTFTIAAGSTTAVLPNGGVFQQGTVAGTITAMITSVTENGVTTTFPAGAQPSVTQTVQALAPVITTGSVQITNVTSTGFTVTLTAYSTTRDLTNATFTFTPASGDTLNGTTQTASLSSVAATWFSSNDGLDAGGSFSLSVPFPYSGSASALGSVSVTLSNSIGTSAAQTATAP
jgi:hypothetical protein